MKTPSHVRWSLALRTLAGVCALLILGITMHQAVHATQDLVLPDATPCVFCHASHSLVGFPVEATRPVVFQAIAVAVCAASSTQRSRDAQLLPFSRPPPALFT